MSEPEIINDTITENTKSAFDHRALRYFVYITCLIVAVSFLLSVMHDGPFDQSKDTSDWVLSFTVWLALLANAIFLWNLMLRYFRPDLIWSALFFVFWGVVTIPAWKYGGWRSGVTALLAMAGLIGFSAVWSACVFQFLGVRFRWILPFIGLLGPPCLCAIVCSVLWAYNYEDEIKNVDLWVYLVLAPISAIVALACVLSKQCMDKAMEIQGTLERKELLNENR